MTVIVQLPKLGILLLTYSYYYILNLTIIYNKHSGIQISLRFPVNILVQFHCPKRCVIVLWLVENCVITNRIKCVALQTPTTLFLNPHTITCRNQVVVGRAHYSKRELETNAGAPIMPSRGDSSVNNGDRFCVCQQFRNNSQQESHQKRYN